MKRIIMSMLLFAVLFSGCIFEQQPYQFPNKNEAIQQIELICNHNNNGEGIDARNFTVLKTLSQAEIPTFMEELYTLETVNSFTEPLWGYGKYIARVTYVNGNVEMFGTVNIEFVPKGETPCGVSDYSFADQGHEFEVLFLKYLE